MGLREEKKEQQRQAILDTAVGLFRERGFEQTRVQDVTDRLRISEATFFNYFPTKQSVLEAAAVDLLDRTTALLHRDVEDDGRPVLERLEELVRSFATHFAGDREFAGLAGAECAALVVASPAAGDLRPAGPSARGGSAAGRGPPGPSVQPTGRDVHRRRARHHQQLVARAGRRRRRDRSLRRGSPRRAAPESLAGAERRRDRIDGLEAADPHGPATETEAAEEEEPVTIDVRVTAELAVLQGVGKTYGDGALAVHALRGVDLNLRAGEFVVVLGPERLGQDDAAEPAGGDRVADGGPPHRGRQRPGHDERRGTHDLPARRGGVRVPVLQPDPVVDGPGERGAGAGTHRPVRWRAGPSGI